MNHSPFDTALREHSALLEYDSGRTTRLQVTKWDREPDSADALLLQRCRGATLDVGCGPGRLTSSLARRGIPAVGIDTSPTAVRMTERRGGIARLCDVFDPLPYEGRWRHILLADENIGIGGDPQHLLNRVRQLLRPGGTALVEVAPPGTGLHRGHARIGGGPWFPWAEIDANTLARLARSTGFALRRSLDRHGRYFLELASAPAPP